LLDNSWADLGGAEAKYNGKVRSWNGKESWNLSCRGFTLSFMPSLVRRALGRSNPENQRCPAASPITTDPLCWQFALLSEPQKQSLTESVVKRQPIYKYTQHWSMLHDRPQIVMILPKLIYHRLATASSHLFTHPSLPFNIALTMVISCL
jgi:hypothetical protein